MIGMIHNFSQISLNSGEINITYLLASIKMLACKYVKKIYSFTCYINSTKRGETKSLDTWYDKTNAQNKKDATHG